MTHRGRARRVLLAARAVRLRQDDLAADDRRLRGARRGPGGARPGTTSSASPPYKRNVNTVFQSYALFPHLTVADNVAFGLRRKKVPKSEITRPGQALPRSRAAATATTSGGRRSSRAASSSGSRSPRALVNEPAVLLLDEPLGALDLKLRKQMQLELMRIQREVGVTFIYVTHDQEEALVMSDRIAVMSQGKVEQIGFPEDIYERPATRFVAGFIGTSNIIEGDGHRPRRRLPAGRVGARRPAARRRAGRPCDQPGRQLAFTVRPEKLRVGGDRRARSRTSCARSRAPSSTSCTKACRPSSSCGPTRAPRSSPSARTASGSATPACPGTAPASCGVPEFNVVLDRRARTRAGGRS